MIGRLVPFFLSPEKIDFYENIPIFKNVAINLPPPLVTNISEAMIDTVLA